MTAPAAEPPKECIYLPGVHIFSVWDHAQDRMRCCNCGAIQPDPAPTVAELAKWGGVDRT